MKLLKCYIENFGKLHNFEYSFHDGLNTIKHENGFGKTTFAVFIKSMFYGLDKSNKTDKSDRVKYKPWQGGEFGGNIEFEIKNKKYRIERFFYSKATDDTFKLYDLSTNLESTDYTENIGEEIFKISKDAYERSTYIPQGQIQIKMEDSLSAKLGNVLESENDVQTSDEAIKKLEDTMKIYKKTGSRGLLNEKTDKLNELKRELEKTEFDEQNLKIRVEKLKQVNNTIKEKQIEKMQKQELLKQYVEQGRKQAKMEIYNNILEKLKENTEKYYNLENNFKNIINENMSEDIIISKCNKLENDIDESINIYPKIQEYEIEIQKKRNDLEVLNKLKTEAEENRKSKEKKSKIYKIFGILIVILGIVLAILPINKLIGGIACILGIVEIICISLKSNNKQDTEKYEELNKKIKNLQEEIEKLGDEQFKIEQKINNLLKNFEKGDEDKIVFLSNLKIKAIEFVNNLRELEKNQKLKLEFEQNNNIDELKIENKIENINENQLNMEIRNLSYDIDKLSDAKNQYKNQIEVLENKIDENEYLETDIENLQEQIKESEEKYFILKQTKDLLKSAKESFASSYLNGMINGYNEILSMIDDKDLSTNVDINLDVKVDVNGAKKDIKYFSTGYKDLIYICMRLSLVKALFKDELPFIILDDPFVNLDEEKTKKALKLLNELSKKYQIIYLICNSSRKWVEKI